ncbi:hypothetical protein ISS86_01700 [Candidatus Microgenomates bacterium]|nr:hypothetical protein [Candidatus Microgenomates bacterium]
MTFKVGDKIVRLGQLYRIFRIKKQKTKGKEERTIFFKAHFRTKQNRTLTYSIPIKNIGKTTIRRPISKKKLKILLKKFSKKIDIKKPVILAQVRGILDLNDISETARILKSLWIEKNDESKNFSKSKEDVFILSMKQLVEEAAFVGEISLIRAGEKIKAGLKGGTKNDKQNKTQK